MNTYHGAGILFWTRDVLGKIHVLLCKQSAEVAHSKWILPQGTWIPNDGFLPDGKRHYLQTAIRHSHDHLGMTAQYNRPPPTIWTLHVPYFNFEVFACFHPELREPQTFNTGLYSESAFFIVDDLPTPREFLLNFYVPALLEKVL